MEIVVLDGYAMNPGDLCWGPIKKLGNCTIYERTFPNEIVERAKDAEIILLNKVVLNEEILKQFPRLKYVCVMATGYNIVDVVAAGKLGVKVANIPAYCTDSVAQMVFAHLMNLTLHVCEHSSSVRNKKWADSKDFAYWIYPLREISGLTIGLIGLGNIGRAVAKIADSFNMKIIAYKPSKSEDIPEYVTMKDSAEEVFGASDIISLHCPLTPTTLQIVNNKTIGLMKKSAYLINTGRGGLIDEQALAEALNEGKIAGAGLDVLSSEPPKYDNPLTFAKNCYITPHIAWATLEARRRLMKTIIANVESFVSGNPINIVN